MVYYTYTHDKDVCVSGQELTSQSEGVASRGIQSLAYRLPVHFITECAPYVRAFYRLSRILGIPRLHSAFCRLRRSVEHIHLRTPL